MLVLVGCARLPLERAPANVNTTGHWSVHREQLLTLSDWTLSGRMAVRTGERGGTASLLWRRAGQHDRVILFGPFGSGRIGIVKDENGAELQDGQQRVYHGDTAESVLMQGVGWHVPFRELGFWVRGLPAPGVIDDLVLDAEGRAAHISQHGWNVDYRAYRAVDNMVLPSKLFIAARPGTVRITADDGTYLGDQLSVRIIIRTWNDEPQWVDPNR